MALERTHLRLTAGIVAAMFLSPAAIARTTADMGPSALTGIVTSTQEGKMEGVLVSAHKGDSTMTITVVTDEKGHYAFPASRLPSGHYTLQAQAIGYDLDGPKVADIAAGKATVADIKLKKTGDLSAQLTNTEWLNSVPGSDEQKGFLIECIGCHTLTRVMKSKTTAPEFERLIAVHTTYAQGTIAGRAHLMAGGGARDTMRLTHTSELLKRAASYFASVNLGHGPWTYPLKTLSRPTGKATHVIVTTYQLPRPFAMPHDTMWWPGDPTHIWYSDFGSEDFGSVEVKTGKITEYKLPILKPGQPESSQDVVGDPYGNVWIAMMYQQAIARFDPKTKKLTTYPIPPETDRPNGFVVPVVPNHMDVDGKVWTKAGVDQTLRLDVKTGKWENFGKMADQNGVFVGSYGLDSDKDNNLYWMDIGSSMIARVDVEAHALRSWSTGHTLSRPRRGHFDSKNVLWFAEYGANGVGSFDPKTNQIHSWTVPLEQTLPYDALRADDGHVWAGGEYSNRVTRLDPDMGEFIDYLLPVPNDPNTTNIRRLTYDEADHSLVFGSNLAGSIIRVEPLD